MAATPQVKPSPADRPGPADQSVSPRASLRPRKQRATRDWTRLQGIILCIALLLLFGLGAFGLKDAAEAFRTTTDDGAAHRSGTIRLVREGDLCRHVTIDNRTGQLTDKGRLSCDKAAPTDPREQLRERYSGGRLDSIRDSFKSR
jgi:hypothetical protein